MPTHVAIIDQSRHQQHPNNLSKSTFQNGGHSGRFFWTFQTLTWYCGWEAEYRGARDDPRDDPRDMTRDLRAPITAVDSVKACMDLFEQIATDSGLSVL